MNRHHLFQGHPEFDGPSAQRQPDRSSQQVHDDATETNSPSSQEHPRDSSIFLAACRIVASGYKAELSRGDDVVLLRAAYELLYRFLELQFAHNSPARRRNFEV